MVGGISASPIPSGQGQNAYQQVQGQQSAAQVEQRDPKENEIQRRNEPAAQSQESRQQSFDAPREASNSNSSGASESQRPGELVNVLV